MPVYDASQAECLVFTYKEGLLSTVAHDLKLRVTRFVVNLGEGRVEATFDPRSLQVVCPMRRGVENPGALSASDMGQVIENMERDVLHTARFSTIRFTSTQVGQADGGWRIKGTLDLHGVKRPLTVSVERDGEHYHTKVRLHQPTWRIKPFRALLGTLKVKPDVEVVVRVPAVVPL